MKQSSLSNILGRLQLQFVLTFVSITILLYAGATIFGAWLFERQAQLAAVEQTAVLGSSIFHDIQPGKVPSLAGWYKSSSNHAMLNSFSIVLYDVFGKVIEHYGAAGIAKLSQSGWHPPYAVTQTPIKSGGKTVGYLQVSTELPDRGLTVRHIADMLMLLIPVLLVALSVAAYIFSAWAIRPIADAFVLLRQFTADVSHELKTPLSIAQLNLESLSIELADKEVRTDRIDIVMSALHRMSKLVADLLVLAETESPGYRPHSQQVDLNGVLARLVMEMKGRFDRAELKVSFDAFVQNALVVGREEVLSRLFMNLLDNACRYTPPGGQIRISLNQDSGRWFRIVVHNTDSYINESDRQRIFDRFYRVDKSRSREDGGAGLGLAIVQAIAKAHGGSVLVESSAERGTSFIVFLPQATTSQKPQE